MLQESVSARGRILVRKEHSSPPFFDSVIFSLGKKSDLNTKELSRDKIYAAHPPKGGSAAGAAKNGIY